VRPETFTFIGVELEDLKPAPEGVRIAEIMKEPWIFGFQMHVPVGYVTTMFIQPGILFPFA
jgi:hypothetical protein